MLRSDLCQYLHCHCTAAGSASSASAKVWNLVGASRTMNMLCNLLGGFRVWGVGLRVWALLLRCIHLVWALLPVLELVP
jgi:hypothetical protein